MKILKYQASKEQNATHKTAPKNRLSILAALVFLLIGLTITNIPIVYSQSSSETVDGGDSSTDGGGGESNDGGDGGTDGGDGGTDGGGDGSNDGGEETTGGGEETTGGGEETTGGGEETTGGGEEQAVEKEEICNNDEDDDDDGKIDGEDSDCKEQQGKNEICGNDEDDDGNGKIDGEDSDCKQQQEDKQEICNNGINDDDDDDIDEEDSDCKQQQDERRVTGTFIVKVKNDNGGSKQPEDFSLSIDSFKVQVKNDNEGSKQPEDFSLGIEGEKDKASPSSFHGAGPPGSRVAFSGEGEFKLDTTPPEGYIDSLESDCPTSEISQGFTCTITYDDIAGFFPEKTKTTAFVKNVRSVNSLGSITVPTQVQFGSAASSPGSSVDADSSPGSSVDADSSPGSSVDADSKLQPSSVQKPLLTPQPFTTYKSDEKSVTIEYPNDWQITENANNVTFKSPPESSSDKFEEALRVLKVPYKSSLSALVDKIVGEAETNLPNFQIINSSDTVLGGIPANSLVYTYTDSRVGTLQEMVVLTIKDDSAYIIGYVAESPKFAYYLPVIQNMINSFEISDADTEPETSSLLPFIPQQEPSAGQSVDRTASNSTEKNSQQATNKQSTGDSVLDALKNIFGRIMGNR